LFVGFQAASLQTIPKIQGRVATPGKRPAPARARPTWPAVELYEVNLNERLWFRPFDAAGHPRKAAPRELQRFLRCWHTGREHKVDARLGRVLYTVARHFAGHRIEVYSGYRPRAFCTREHSRHLTASAVDFAVSGVRNEAVVAWLRQNLHPVGVGYYPHGVHVHLDVDRTHDTYWIDAGDAPDPQPVALGDAAPQAREATADEPVEVAVPEPADPPFEDPGMPDLR
jgi:uncharacterized protein YcbK (DUF882 family)